MDKFEYIMTRLENLVTEAVTHERLQQTLDKYARDYKVTEIQESLETFVTKTMNSVDKSTS